MADTPPDDPHRPHKQLRGFALMDPARRREVAKKGGASVPSALRAFSQNRTLASTSGRKGGSASRGGGRPTKPGDDE